MRYMKLKGPGLLKPDALESARKRWVTRKAGKLMARVAHVLKEHFGRILKMIAHRSGFLIVDHGELLLYVV